MGYYFRGRYVEDASDKKLPASPAQQHSFRGRKMPSEQEVATSLQAAEIAEENVFTAKDLMHHCLNLGFGIDTLGDGSKVLRWRENGTPTKKIFMSHTTFEVIRDWVDAKYAELYSQPS